MTRPEPFEPPPPRAPGRLPWLGSGLGFLRDPTGFLEAARRRCGDTFRLDVFGYSILFVFSPEGVRNLWALPEAQASKGLADFALLRHKVPDELFAGRRTFPHGLFAREDVEVYLENLHAAIALHLDELGDAGEVELFALTRRLGHRVGLASWGSLLAAEPRYLDRLIPALDTLDSSDSFVHPHKAMWSTLTGKRREREALAQLDAVFAELLAERERAGDAPDDLLAQICAAWQDEPSPAREIGIGRDIVLVHMGSQSNLFAAMAWTLVHLLERPELLARVRDGDVELLERCANETIRLRQRSLVLRQSTGPVVLADETTSWHVGPGQFIATMMSVTNTSVLDGLDRFDPENYDRRMFRRARELPARELVTTFGHGKHSCPAQGFSLSAIRHSVVALLDKYEIEPLFDAPQPLRRQLGGVARADRPCRVRYRLRASEAPRSAS